MQSKNCASFIGLSWLASTQPKKCKTCRRQSFERFTSLYLHACEFKVTCGHKCCQNQYVNGCELNCFVFKCKSEHFAFDKISYYKCLYRTCIYNLVSTNLRTIHRIGAWQQCSVPQSLAQLFLGDLRFKNIFASSLFLSLFCPQQLS